VFRGGEIEAVSEKVTAEHSVHKARTQKRGGGGGGGLRKNPKKKVKKTSVCFGAEVRKGILSESCRKGMLVLQRERGP